MILEFRLSWSSSPAAAKAFKLAGARSLFVDYLERLSHYAQTRTGGDLKTKEKFSAGSQVWLCDTAPGAKNLSSEALAERLGRARDSGLKHLYIVIGGPDGFSAAKREAWQPALAWTFGALTLPHELAAVVATEQLYRAWTILHKQPYHWGH